MFSRSTPEPPPTAPANAETRFSLPELRKLHKQLVENKRVNDNNQNLVVEILRVIAEMVVYGDNKSELLFDFFCEKNMLSLFLEIMGTPGGCASAVHIQILQTLSILISCVRNETSLYYLLSNNYVNEIINYPHDFMNDESLCAQFASFMKTLSLKLNIHTVQFFFIEETGAFPILTRAVELLTIPDPMIRIASQSTILNVYRVEDSRARAYALQDEVMGIMFAQTVNFMENQYHTIFKTCKLYYKACNANDEAESTKMESKIDDILSSMEDWFYYLQDLLDLDVPILRKALVHQLIHDFLLPVLLGPLLKHHSVYVDEEKSKQRGGRCNHSADYLFKSEERASDRGRLSLVLDDVQFEIYDNIELIASLSYLLQMLKIVTHPALQRAVLVTIFHPLSLDCRTQILRELEAAHSHSHNSAHGHGHGHGHGQGVGRNISSGSLDTTPIKNNSSSVHHSSTTTPATTVVASTNNTLSPNMADTPTPASITTPLSANHIKAAWDRLQHPGSQKVTLLMMYIEHILLERIVSTAVDCFPGNEGNITIEEEYISTYPAITPLRTVADPRSDAILMLQWLYFLPNREHCEAYVTSAAVARSLNLSSQPCSPAPTMRKSLGNAVSNPEVDGNGTSMTSVEGIALPTDPAEADHADLWSSDIHLDEPESPAVTSSSEVAVNLTSDCDAEAVTATSNNAAHTLENVSFKTAQNTSSDSLDGLALPSAHPMHTEDGAEEEGNKEHLVTDGVAALPTSTSNSNLHPDSFVSPAASKRIKLGRNDMLLPAESTMGVGLNSADQLMLTALRRLDEVYTEKVPFYPEMLVKYSVDPIFQVLCESHNYSVTTIQVAAHAVYSLCLLLASTRPVPTALPRASFSSLARSSLNLLSNTVGSVGKVVSPGGYNNTNNTNSNNSKSNGSSKNNSKANSFSEPPVVVTNNITNVAGAVGGIISQPEYSLRNKGDINQCLLDYCFVRVREAGKLAAMKLLVRLEGTMSEMLLNVIREEVARSEGQKWRRCIERMYQDVLLFLPATQFSSERMGIDFDLPNSQVETIRKEVQSFLAVRALYRQLQAINSTSVPCPETETADNLFASITDKGFLSLEEKNLLPANSTVGSPFDMRGKRFLEVRLIPVQHKTSVDGVSSLANGTGAAGANTPDNGSRTHSPARHSSSMWGLNTKRLFGGGSSSSTQISTSHQNSPASPVPNANNAAAAVVASNDPILQLVATKKKILFVQDNKNLYLVTCEKADSRSGFKVLIAAPLLYTDAQMDPHDVHKFRVTVRSQREVEYMYPCEPDLSQLYREGGSDTLLASHPGTTTTSTAAEGTPSHGSNGNLAALNGTKSASKTANGGYPPHNKYVAPKLESMKFLKARGKTNFFTLTVRVESELACRLAVQHIENKRKEQAEAKIAQFQHILEHWSSERDIDVTEH